jgi:hypothetical protein
LILTSGISSLVFVLEFFDSRFLHVVAAFSIFWFVQNSIGNHIGDDVVPYKLGGAVMNV